MWIIGFSMEAIADFQKFKFKSNFANKGKFINTGCWEHIRYPNYLGEFILWWGIFVIGCSVYTGAQFALALSPAYIMFQIIFVSGIRIQEQQAEVRYRGNDEYEKWSRHTNFCNFFNIFKSSNN